MTMTLEHRIMDFEGEQAGLETNNMQTSETFQQFTDHIQKDRKTVEENNYPINQQKRDIEEINVEKARLENILLILSSRVMKHVVGVSR